MRTNLRPAVAAALLAGLLVSGVACESAPARPAADPDGDAVLLGELLQFRRDVPARRLQVRLTATEPGLVVGSLEVAARGLPTAPADPRLVELRPGAAVDLPVVMEPGDCTQEPGPPEAVVRLRGPDGERQLTVPLEDGGLVARLHAADCADQDIRAQAEVTVAEVVPTVADGRPALRVTVRLSRLAGTDAVRVTGIGSNTVYAISAAGPLPTLDTGAVTLPLTMIPARCDTHALGESYRTSLIGLVVALGDDEPRPFVLTPPDAIRRQLETFAVETCRSAEG